MKNDQLKNDQRINLTSHNVEVSHEPVRTNAPCPFCGSSNLQVWYLSVLGAVPARRVACIGCGALGPSHKNHKQAVRVWEDRDFKFSRAAHLSLQDASGDVPKAALLDVMTNKAYTLARQLEQTEREMDELMSAYAGSAAGDGLLESNRRLRTDLKACVRGLCDLIDGKKTAEEVELWLFRDTTLPERFLD